MKNKASIFFKKIALLLNSIAKSKSMAIKNKTNAVKARLIMFSLLKSKKVLLGSVSDKIHKIFGQHDKEQDENDNDDEDQSKAIVLYNNATANESCSGCIENDNDYDDDDDKYPDLTHSLFDEVDDFNDPGGSIIDLVKNSKEEGEDFSLEDEIDHVADLFIMRFHKQMRLQKLESFKRFQEMLARSV